MSCSGELTGETMFSEMNKSAKDQSEPIDVESTSPALNSSDSLCVPGKKRAPSECSHKVIEKRRRDRINKCLVDLGHIVPKAQGSSKLEKAEVLELTVEYINNLHNATKTTNTVEAENQTSPQEKAVEQPTVCTKRELQSYSKGYSDCTTEVLRFMINVEATDPQLPCFQRLMAHLRNNCRLLVDFENARKDQHNSLESTAIFKQRGHGNRSLSSAESPNGTLITKMARNNTDSPTNYSTMVVGNDDPKPSPSISGMTLEDKMKAAFKNGNGKNDGSSSHGSGNGSMNTSNSNVNKGTDSNTNATYPNANLLPFTTGYQPSYGFPGFALLPAGTHYIPVPIHPGLQLPGNNLGGSMISPPIITPGFGYLGSPMSIGLSLGGFSNVLGGAVSTYGGPLSGMGGLTGIKGAEGLPAHLAQEKKELNRERVNQDLSGSSDGSSGDDYNFSTTSSSNISEVGIQTDQPNDHSDYYSAGSR